MKKLIISAISVVLILGLGSDGNAQVKNPQQAPTKLPKNIKLSNDPIVIEDVSVSNDINMQYTIRLYNNTSQPIPLKQLSIEITHDNGSVSTPRSWIPSLELLQPSINSEIPPSQAMELKFRCCNSQDTVLQQLDNGILIYNGTNNILVKVQFMGRWYTHRSTFIWKPQLADLKINDVKVELNPEDFGNWFRFRVSIENAGDALPIFFKTTGKTRETSLLNVLLVRRKDGKEKQYKAFPEVKSEREGSLSTYLDSYLRLNPGEKKELVFRTSSSAGDLLDLIGEFEVTVGFDSPAWKTNSEYPYVISDADRRNNVMTKSVSLGGDCFEIISFFPEKISKYKPAEGPQREFPRKEQNLIYLELRSYLPLLILDEATTPKKIYLNEKVDPIGDFKVYFNDEELRIFNVTGDPKRGIYRVWIEEPEKRERGRFKVNILGVSKFSNKFLEVETKFASAPESTSPKLPYYYESPAPPVPFPYIISLDTFPYGVKPISIEGVNIREKDGKVNVLVSLRSRDYTWLEEGKRRRDLMKEKENTGADIDLSKYVDAPYWVYLFIRPKNKIKWRDMGALVSPRKLEADKRAVVSFTFDLAEAMFQKGITLGENEFLIVITYLVTEEELSSGVPSDMYWGVFTLGK